VKIIVREHFVFWQQTIGEGEEAQSYRRFYNIDAWPYVAVLDPRTGELLVTWNNVRKFNENYVTHGLLSQIPDANCFCDLVTDFLTLHPSFGGNKAASVAQGSSASASKRARTDDDNSAHSNGHARVGNNILDADEDAQLEAAIRASLAEADGQHKAKASVSMTSSELDFGCDSPAYNVSCSDSNSQSNSPLKPVRGQPVNDSDDQNEKEEVTDTWQQYLGEESDEKSSILIRFPDGQKETKEMPCSSQFKVRGNNQRNQSINFRRPFLST